MNGEYNAVIGNHGHVGVIHIFCQEGDISQCMIFAFAGCSNNNQVFHSLLYTKLNRLGEVVGKLVGVGMNYIGIADFVFFRNGIAIAHNSVGMPSASDETVITVNGGGGCDFDGDTDVDLLDFSAFQSCFNGPNRLPKCG